MTVKKKGHILIVDDAPDIRLLLGEFFVREGYTVADAANGLEALAYLQSSLSTPDLILLDLMMPEMDGYQFRQEQEKDERLAEVPVVVMTAGANVQSKAIRIGAKDYLKKPFENLDTILRVVNRHMAG